MKSSTLTHANRFLATLGGVVRRAGQRARQRTMTMQIESEVDACAGRSLPEEQMVSIRFLASYDDLESKSLWRSSLHVLY